MKKLLFAALLLTKALCYADLQSDFEKAVQAYEKAQQTNPAAFMEAVDKGDLDEVQVFVKNGMELNAYHPYGPEGRPESPINLAVSNGNLEMAKLLVKLGADPAADAPVFMAVRNRDINMVKFLVGLGVPLYSEEGAGWTALHVAAGAGSYEVAEFLLSLKILDINGQDEEGNTALMRVSETETHNSELLLKLLLKSGAKINLANSFGQTALDWAYKYDNKTAIAALQKRGAKRGKK